ncbi:NADH-quinone oxidoreductase subunit J family protein [Sphingobacterium endophyticum]|uniref:NADH-quinone oxidoreductase subunit J family protein n=1 Tax=Sphingobacterium endophyticum TaxID=2546448 RepID=UPI0012E2A39C|nr:NADH-quinone oxidoreductase subunit J [Sphingobacterium endophyticum]
MELAIFYAFAALVIGSALLVVSLKNTARSLFLFFIVLFGMAGLFIFALADFVAITQIMVYVGGVLILMIFAFMLSNKELLADLQNTSSKFLSIPNWQSLLLSIGFLAVMSYGIIEWHDNFPQWITENIRQGNIIKSSDNNINQLGIKFMTQYLLPFEVISIFLLAALIGAAHLSRKEDPK